ncbi:MAG: hypothetical protein J6D30_02345 [Clostridia bacterium]|nr:hypothetical protein [Clostridia bacterium]
MLRYFFCPLIRCMRSSCDCIKDKKASEDGGGAVGELAVFSVCSCSKSVFSEMCVAVLFVAVGGFSCEDPPKRD